MTMQARRELASRQRPWAKSLASALAAAGLAPNAVSIASTGFAGIAAFALWSSGQPGTLARTGFLLIAAASIQLRLLCNLLDGMLAVEEGLQTRTGALYNEVPDRVSDVLILAAAGYSIAGPGGIALGWAAAVAALFTAYVRLLGGALTGTQHFTGPMAKPQRMFVLTVACVLSAAEATAGRVPRLMMAALIVIVLGSAATAWRRVVRIAGELEPR
jgi:phosphatidylglycerophosphate synthase